VRTDHIQVTLSGDARGLLIVSPEPIDWTRLSAGAIRVSSAVTGPTASSTNESVTASQTSKLVHNSDFTQAILLRADGPPKGMFTFLTFNSGVTYLWDIREYVALPPHLSWLDGWVTHRATTHTLAFEIP
jgi:hypothetical protein